VIQQFKELSKFRMLLEPSRDQSRLLFRLMRTSGVVLRN
jgi:hypothetical protein